MIGQKSYENDIQLQYDVSRTFGVRAGFVWNQLTIQPRNEFSAALGDIYFPNTPNRGNCVGVPLNPDGSCTFIGVIEPWEVSSTEINRYSAVIGAWYRNGSLRANVNAQIGGADNYLYRIDPTTFFNVKGNVSYAPRPWLMLAGNFIFEQAQNNSGDINFNQHNYVAMANAGMADADGVAAVDLTTGIPLRCYRATLGKDREAGAASIAMALSKDGTHLYAASASLDAVAVRRGSEQC
jgi:hypothetical protein